MVLHTERIEYDSELTDTALLRLIGTIIARRGYTLSCIRTGQDGVHIVMDDDRMIAKFTASLYNSGRPHSITFTRPERVWGYDGMYEGALVIVCRSSSPSTELPYRDFLRAWRDDAWNTKGYLVYLEPMIGLP